MYCFGNILRCLLMVLLIATEVKGDCTKPSTSDHATVHKDDISKETFEEQSTVRLECHPGYEPASGPRRFTCQNGQWTPSPTTFVCKKKTCGNPGEVQNGNFEFQQGVEFGDVIKAVCKDGFYIVGRTDTMTCGADGQWSGAFPVCEAKKCGPPPAIPNGKLTSPPNDEYDVGQAVQYGCDSGYDIFGDVEPLGTVYCKSESSSSIDGIWSSLPRCTKVECQRPDIAHAKRVEGGSGPYGYKVTLKYECLEGFKMTSDSGRIVCEEHGWSSTLQCEAKKPKPIWIIILIILGVLCGIAGFVVACFRWKKKREKQNSNPRPQNDAESQELKGGDAENGL